MAVLQVLTGDCRKTNQEDVADFKNIPVDKDTTADEVLQRVLCKLGDEVNLRNTPRASSLMDSLWTESSVCFKVLVYVLWLQMW